MSHENEEGNAISQVCLFHLKVGRIFHMLQALRQIHVHLILYVTEVGKAHLL